MRRIAILTALLAGVTVTHVAVAQSITAGGVVQGRLGYADNPFLQLNAPGGTGTVGGSLTGWLQRRSETSRTRLTGVASLDGYLQDYGRAENYLVSLEHDQTISAKLSASASVRYQDSINPRDFSNLNGGDLVGAGLNGVSTDLLSIGQRTRTISADGTIQWAPTSRDSFYIGPEYQHAFYPNNALSDFDQYGLRGGYLRKVNAKLSVGIDLRAQQIKSQNFPDSKSYQASVRMVYDFSPIWRFDGSVGLIRQVSDLGGSRTTPGFSGRLCGRYPRYRICVEGSRQSATSGFGGLRTDNRVSANLSYDLTTRSQLTFAAVYNVSESAGTSTIPNQKFFEVSGGYVRSITDRLSAGFSGRYQYRDYGSLAAQAGVTDTSVTGYSGTLDVAYKFGRIE